MKTHLRHSFKALFLTVLMVYIVAFAQAATYYLTTSGAGNAQTASNWNTGGVGGGGTAASNFITSGDVFIISSGTAGTFLGTTTTFAAGVTLQVDGTFTIGAASNNSRSVVVNGTVIFSNTSSKQVTIPTANNPNTNNFTLGAGATLKTANANGVSGTNCSLPASATRATVSLNNSADYEFTGASQNMTGMPATVSDLTFSGSGTKTFAQATTISGNLNISSGVSASLGTYTSSSAILYFAGVRQISGSWGSTASSATNKNLSYFGTTATGVLNVNPTFYSITTGNWNSNTTWSLTSGGSAVGTGIFPGAGDKVVIEGGDNVTVTSDAACASVDFSSATTANTYLTINSGITLSISGAITIPRASSNINTLAVGAGIVNAGSIAFTNDGSNKRHEITISTGTLDVSGNIETDGSGTSANITFTGAGTLKVGGTFFQNGGGTLTPSTGTVEYDGSGAQTISDFTYYSLATSNGGTKTMQAATIVGGNVTIGAGTTLNEAAYTMTLAAASILTVNGTLDFTSSTGLIQSGTSGTTTLTMGSTGIIRTVDALGIGPVTNASLVTQSGGGMEYE